MKKLIPILLMIGILFLSGCNPIPKDGYLYIEEGGYYYLVFRDLEPAPPGFPSKNAGACLTFSSVAELKTATENLSKEQIAAMKKLFARDNEKNRIYVCNFEQFYEPVFPDNVISNQTVSWMSMHYFVLCTFTFDEETVPAMGITTPGTYKTLLAQRKTKFDNIEKYDSLSKEHDAARNAEVYTYIDGYLYPGTDRIPKWKKEVYYTLMEGDKQVHVVEEYISSDQTERLDDFPHFVSILISDNGGYLTGSFYWHQEELPSADWLLSFGVKPFVQEETAA